MRTPWATPVIAAVLLAAGAGTADARYCGALRCCRVKRAGCCESKCTCCRQCYVVMKTCRETVYEPREVTTYKTVYKEVIDKVTVPAVKYVPQTAYRYMPSTIMQPGAPGVCRPAEGCAAAACEPVRTCQPCDSVPVKCVQKVPYETFKPVAYEKVIERPRVVTERVPYTVTCYEPRVVCKQVPVEVCCPVPCCGRVKRCGSCGCGG